MTKGPPPLTDDEVYDFLARSVNHMLHRTDVGLGPGERGRLYAWYWGYYGRAAVDFYVLTGQQRFAALIETTWEELLRQRDDALGLVDDERGRIMPSWGTRYTTGKRSNEITTSGLITLPVLEYAHVSQTQITPDAALETLWSFRGERKEASGGCYYFENMTQGIVEALNHANLYGAALVRATQLTADPWFEDTALGLHRYFASHLRRRGDQVYWPYAPRPTGQQNLPCEAIWKAAATIELPVALSETGMPMQPDLLDEIADSFSQHPAVLAGGLPQFLDHDRADAVQPGTIGGGLTSLVGAFLQIDDHRLHRSIIALMRESPELFPNGWRGGSRAMIMAWAHLRRAGAVDQP